jgi:hypothetical protein
MTDLTTLADRVEKLEAGDREVDADIYVAAVPGRHNTDALSCIGSVAFWVPAYTSSLDAAMTLLPSDCWWVLEKVALAPGLFAEVVDHKAKAATPALALTAACLRARAALQDKPDD